MRSMYDLSLAFDELLSTVVDDVTGEVTDSVALEELDGAVKAKIQGVAYVVRHLQSDAEDLSDEIDRLSLRKKSLTKNAETLRRKLAVFMRATGNEKVRTPDITVSLRKPVPAVNVVDYDLLPENCWRVQRSPNKTMIMEIINRDGNCTGAELVTGAPVVSIR